MLLAEVARPFVNRKTLDYVLQEGRKARSCYTQYHRIMRDLLDEVKARGARLAVLAASHTKMHA